MIIYLLLLLLLLSCSTEPEDCAGVKGGSAELDMCGICDRDITNDCKQDCEDVWGGNSYLDDCGVCNGNNITDCLMIDYSLTDLNQNSFTFGNKLSKGDFLGRVVLYYFPSSDT